MRRQEIVMEEWSNLGYGYRKRRRRRRRRRRRKALRNKDNYAEPLITGLLEGRWGCW